MRQKTTAQIYDQWQRLFRKFMSRGKRLAAAAHPETGGRELEVGNWGNAAAKAAWAETWARETKARKAYDRLYNAAEHRKHTSDIRPLWCEHCQAERAARRAPTTESERREAFRRINARQQRRNVFANVAESHVRREVLSMRAKGARRDG